MVIGVKEATAIKRALGKLQLPESDATRAQYKELRRRFIGMNEENDADGKPHCYDDPKGRCTVGIGFDMDRVDPKTNESISRQEWNAAFAASPAKPDFDKVKSGEVDLTQDQINTLFNYSADHRESVLKKSFGPEIWAKLKYNERLAIEDIFYNGGFNLVGDKTHFHQEIDKYALTGKREHLDNALWEISRKSNDEKRQDRVNTKENAEHAKENPGEEPPHAMVSKGVQHRRAVEAIMLNTYDVDVAQLKKPAYYAPKKKVNQKKAEIDVMPGIITADVQSIGDQLKGAMVTLADDDMSNNKLPARRTGKDTEIS
jgi:hypothetical protein